MNHPGPEEWMSYLYDEQEPRDRAVLDAHLNECAQCKSEMDRWLTARGCLDEWRISDRPARRTAAPTAFSWMKYAAAAVFILCVGIVAGRLGTQTIDAEEIRAAVEQGIRTELRQEFARELASLSTALEQQRTADHEAFEAALEKMDAQRIADFMALKQDLDTVAILTDAGLRQTAQRLVQLTGAAMGDEEPTQ